MKPTPKIPPEALVQPTRENLRGKRVILYGAVKGMTRAQAPKAS